MEPLKILFVASEAPPVVSGVARSVGEIADGLARRGHQVSVWSSADSPGLRWDRLRVSSLGLTLRKRLRQNGPFDIVNIHGPAPTISD
ncbi:MAG: glycosyltransferase, partial [Actinomycetota bacterium]